ncbi:MAG: hypothetical protein HYY16_17720 [Planctomycetes bacterium]|nr:hypothetical protein [Planctomycetota bacterium]
MLMLLLAMIVMGFLVVVKHNWITLELLLVLLVLGAIAALIGWIVGSVLSARRRITADANGLSWYEGAAQRVAWDRIERLDVRRDVPIGNSRITVAVLHTSGRSVLALGATNGSETEPLGVHS